MATGLVKPAKDDDSPVLRHFRVTRYQPNNIMETETLDLMAHSMQFTRGGDLLVVIYTPVDEGEGFITQYARVFNHNHWIDYEEISVQKTGLLIN